LEGMKILDSSKVIGVTTKLLDVPNKVREVYLNFRGNTLMKYYEKLGYKRKEIENLRHEGVIC
jgi:hypothetical protein